MQAFDACSQLRDDTSRFLERYKKSVMSSSGGAIPHTAAHKSVINKFGHSGAHSLHRRHAIELQETIEMQGQSLIAGLRALVEQIDRLEQKAAQRQADPVFSRVDIQNYSAENLYSNRASIRGTLSRAAGIVQKLGVTNADFARVAHAGGRNGHWSH